MTKAVLYVCADRGTLMPDLAATRAEEEGRAYADRRDLTITEVITDPYGDPDPARRTGWQRVRELAQQGGIEAVVVRWPTVIAPGNAAQHETLWLSDHGVRVHYSWPPLTSGGDT
ncbi:hypothetical protein AB0D90_03755 [Streptomyces althioticus]|uniref:hypothetical protein n=1 Tax=Streptomyces althioticus TaxID=83380 RepID=UPI0033E83229